MQQMSRKLGHNEIQNRIHHPGVGSGEMENRPAGKGGNVVPSAIFQTEQDKFDVARQNRCVNGRKSGRVEHVQVDLFQNRAVSFQIVAQEEENVFPLALSDCLFEFRLLC